WHSHAVAAALELACDRLLLLRRLAAYLRRRGPTPSRQRTNRLSRHSSKQLRNLARAVGERIQPHSGAIQDCQVQIGERLWLRVADVPAALASGASRYEHRQIRVIVLVAIAHAAAIQVQRVIEERAISVGCRFELLQEGGEQPDMERVDLSYLGQHFKISAIV